MAVPIRPREELIVLSQDEGHVIAVYNPIAIVCFRRAPRDPEIDLLGEVLESAKRAGLGGGVLYVVAREDMASGVPTRLRRLIEGSIRGGFAGPSAVVLSMEGFGGAMIRSLVAGIILLGADQDMVHVYREAERAIDWLARQHQIDRTRLADAYRRACEPLAA